MVTETPIKKWEKFVHKVTLGELIKGMVFNIVYLFFLTVIGSLMVSAYNYFYPLDVMSEASVLIAASIFTAFVIVDLGLLMYFNKPSPTLIVLLIVISPLFVIYKLVKDADFIRIDRSTPQRLKRYIPLRIVNSGLS